VQYLAYVHIHGFYTKVIEATSLGLADRPLGIHHGKTVLCANAAAVERGISVDQPLSEAKVLVPEAEFVPWMLDTYEAAQERWLEVCAEFSDRIETLEQHAAYVDLSDHGAPAELAIRLTRQMAQIFGDTVAVGLAKTRWVAKVSAASLRQTAIADELRLDGWLNDPAACLATLPVAALSPVTPANRQRLEFLGYRTIGDVADLPLETLKSHFGSEGLTIYQAARGSGGTPLIPDYPRRSVQERLTFDEAVIERAVLDQGLQQVASRLSRRLQNADLAGQEVRLWVEDDEGAREQAERSFAKNIYSSRSVLVALTLMIEPLLPKLQGVRKIRVQLLNLKPNKRLQARFAGLQPEREQGLAGTVEQLATTFGSGVIQRAAEVSLSRRRELMRVWKRATGWR
jgi:DNA polymerase IV